MTVDVSDSIVTALSETLHALPDGVLVVDGQHRIAFANRAAEHLFGFPFGDLEGRSLDVLIPHSRRAAHRHAVAGYAVTGESLRGHSLASVAALHADGHEFPVAVALSRAHGFGPTFVMALIRDQSDREYQARVLEERTEQFRLLAEASHDALYTWSPGAGTQWLGDGLTRFLGYDGVDLTDWSWWERRIHPDDRACVMSSIAAYMASSLCSWSMEYRFQRATGEYAAVLNRSIATRSDDGSLRQVFGALMDISLLRQSQAAERVLESSQRLLTSRLELIVNAMPAACIVSNADDQITYANPAATALFGVAVSDLMGRQWPAHFLVASATSSSNEPLKTSETGATKAGRPSAAAPSTLELRTPRGRHITVAWTSATLRNSSGSDDQLSMLQDLTAHRALQQQIMHAQKVEALGRLAGGVAHDFNNLLTAILTSCDVLTDALADHDPRRQDAEDIRRTAIRATNLTKQLLTFSRDGGGTPKRTCLNDVVRDLERLVCRLVGPTLDVTVSVCSTPLFALVDPTRLEQVLMNLAVNARDAMPNGGRLEIALTADDAGDIPATRHGARRARLSVRDNGPGIAPEIIDHIFEPFFTTKDADHGTGLGLSICAAIVREAGGHLEVVSDHAGGSTFVVRLPVLEEPLASAEALRYA